MRRVLTLACAICLAAATGAMSQGHQGTMLASGYVGYMLGFGEPFDEVRGLGATADIDPNFTFGGMFHYGLTEKFLIGAELGFQNYTFQVDFDDPLLQPLERDDSELDWELLGNVMYSLYQTESDDLFLTLGAGLFNFEESNEFGFNGGVMYRKVLSGNFAMFVMPRLQFVTSDPSLKMLTLAVGFSIPLGAQQ